MGSGTSVKNNGMSSTTAFPRYTATQDIHSSSSFFFQILILARQALLNDVTRRSVIISLYVVMLNRLRVLYQYNNKSRDAEFIIFYFFFYFIFPSFP